MCQPEYVLLVLLVNASCVLSNAFKVITALVQWAKYSMQVKVRQGLMHSLHSSGTPHVLTEDEGEAQAAALNRQHQFKPAFQLLAK